MADDFTGAVEAGWGAVVGQLGVGEVAEFHVGRQNSDIEALVRSNILIMLRERDQR